MGAGQYPFVGNAQTFLNDFAINNANPGMEYGGTETGALYYEDREIGGAMYRVQNATYNKVSQSWVLINPALPAYGQALLANGTTEFLSSPAGTSPFTSWTVVYSTTNTGVSTISPTVSTIPAATDASGIGIFNVKHYGATGNGTTDDYAAITAAISAAGVGGFVFFPAGVYLISRPIVPLRGQTIAGEGAGGDYAIETATTTIRPDVVGNPGNFLNGTSGPLTGVISCNPAGVSTDDVTVQNLCIDGNHRTVNFNDGSGQSFHAPLLQSGNRTKAIRVQFYDAQGFGVWNYFVNDVRIFQCEFNAGGSTNSNDGVGGTNANGLQVIQCRWQPGYQSSTTMLDVLNVSNGMIVDCVFASTQQHGIQLEPWLKSFVARNQFLNGAFVNLQTEGAYNNYTNCTNPLEVNISSNYFAGGYLFVQFHKGTTTTTKGGYLSIENNIFDTPNVQGIWFESSSEAHSSSQDNSSYGGSIIRGNIVRNANNNNVASPQAFDGWNYYIGGIIIPIWDNNLLVDGNTVCDDRGSPQQYTGIFFGSTGLGSNVTASALVINNTTSGYTGPIGVQRGDPQHSPNVILRHNKGVNPVGSITLATYGIPSTPVSGTAYTNTTGTDVTVAISGGTITSIAIGGVVTNLTSGNFVLPAGQTITPVFSAWGSWTWFGN